MTSIGENAFEQAIIKGIEDGKVEFENLLFERFHGLEKTLDAPEDIKFEIYVSTITDVIINIRKKRKSIGLLKPYIYQILKNKWNKWLKKSYRAIVEIGDNYATETENIPDSIIHDSELKEELMRLLEDVLHSLPEKCRDILQSKYCHGLKFREIAEMYDFASEGSARGANHDCMRRARTIGFELFETI